MGLFFVDAKVFCAAKVNVLICIVGNGAWNKSLVLNLSSMNIVKASCPAYSAQIKSSTSFGAFVTEDRQINESSRISWSSWKTF